MANLLKISKQQELNIFSLENLPLELAEEKTNKKQIEMCFRANSDEHWETTFD